MPIQPLHPSADKLGSSCKTKIPRPENPSVKNWLQIGLLSWAFYFLMALRTATQLLEDDQTIINIQLTFGGVPCPFWVGSLIRINLWLSKQAINEQQVGPKKIAFICATQNPNSGLLTGWCTFCNWMGIDCKCPCQPSLIHKCIHQQHHRSYSWSPWNGKC